MAAVTRLAVSVIMATAYVGASSEVFGRGWLIGASYIVIGLASASATQAKIAGSSFGAKRREHLGHSSSSVNNRKSCFKRNS